MTVWPNLTGVVVAIFRSIDPIVGKLLITTLARPEPANTEHIYVGVGKWTQYRAESRGYIETWRLAAAVYCAIKCCVLMSVVSASLPSSSSSSARNSFDRILRRSYVSHLEFRADRGLSSTT